MLNPREIGLSSSHRGSTAWDNRSPKLTLRVCSSQESRCRVTNDRWDFVCESRHRLKQFCLAVVVWPPAQKKTAGGLAAFTSYYEESDRGHTITANPPTNYRCPHQSTQEYIKGKPPLLILWKTGTFLQRSFLPACLEIRLRNEEAINSTQNRIYSLKVFYFLLYRR